MKDIFIIFDFGELWAKELELVIKIRNCFASKDTLFVQGLLALFLLHILYG